MDSRRHNNQLLYSTEVDRSHYMQDARKRSLSPGAGLNYYQTQTNASYIQNVPQGQVLYQTGSPLSSQIFSNGVGQSGLVQQGGGQSIYSTNERVQTHQGVSTPRHICIK